MKSLLVTAGGTWEPLDAVRVLGNRSTGSTGLAIARHAHTAGWKVELLLSRGATVASDLPFSVHRFESHADLSAQMEKAIQHQPLEAVVHAAAVGDYRPTGWYEGAPGAMVPLTPAADGAKVGSGKTDLWIRLEPLPKILGKIRRDWGFHGCLVSFKLEEGADPVLRARESLVSSGSDLVVANTWSHHENEAFLVESNPDQPVIRIDRSQLASRVVHFLDRHLLSRA